MATGLDPTDLAWAQTDTFFRLSPDLLGVIGGDGYFKRANLAWERCLGWTLEQLLARPYIEFVHPDDRATSRAEAAKLAKGATSLHFCNRLACRDGSYRWLEWNTAPDEEGEQLFCAARDVTVERQARQYTRSLIEASLDPLVTINPKGKITDVNEATVRVTGVEREKLLGSDFSRHFTQPEKAREAYRRVFAEGFVTDYPLTFRSVDGTLTEVIYNATLYRDAAGVGRGVVAAARDVSDLRSAHGRAELVIENAPIVIFAVNRSGVLTLTEGSALKSMGLTAGENVGRPFLDVFGDVPGILEHFERAQTGASGVVQAPIGNVVLRICYSPTFTADGFPNGFSAIGVDVTDQVKAESELQRSQTHLAVTLEKAKNQAAELSRSNAELAKFAYVASHDLQEPLRKVSSFCQLLQERYAEQLDERAREYIHYAVDGAQRMQQLMLSVLEWARVGNAPVTQEEVDCTAALHEAMANLQSAIEESGAQVSCAQLPVIRCGRTRIVQLLQNLLSNAIKFRRDRAPVIHVSAQRTDEGWCFSVADNGIGIAEEYQEQVFEVFQRLHTRDEYPGTGVGLAVCKRILESRGGRIWVESLPGQGSTFSWTCPDEG